MNNDDIQPLILAKMLRLHNDERLYHEADVLMGKAAMALEELSRANYELSLENARLKGREEDSEVRDMTKVEIGYCGIMALIIVLYVTLNVIWP